MMINLLYYLTYASAVGAGLLAGVFFAFSAFVMQSLAKLPVEKGISVMQSINSTILQSSFMLVFMGTTVLSVVLGIASFIKMGRTSAIYVIVGSLLIIFGVFMVTAIFNVPLNDTLAAATSGSSEGLRHGGILGQLGTVESCADNRIDWGTYFIYMRYSQVVSLSVPS